MNFGILLDAVRQIPGDQFFLTRWISIIFGYIIDFIFNIVQMFTVSNSLGISLVALTLIARVLMIPIAVKQQKSMFIMNKIQPEMKKIQDKYAGREKDPEISRKMQAELQKLYAKHNYNPFSGCLPMLIQLPIFIALYYVMQNPYLYITAIGNIYKEITDFLNLSEVSSAVQSSGLMDIIIGKIPDFANFAIGDAGSAEFYNNWMKILGVFTASDWNVVSNIANEVSRADIATTVSNLESIVTFCGVNLTENVSDNIWDFTNLKFLIPVVSGLSTFFSSWLMTRRTKAISDTAKQQQRIMNIVMPFFMAFITLNLPCGVGVYWITSNIFQIAQQVVINRIYSNKYSIEEVKK